MLAHDQGHIDAIALLHNLYLTILTSETVNVVKAVHTVAAAPEHKSVLVHCTAGKDRTGIIVALLLDVCDVPRAQIVADYTLSHSYLSGPWEHGMRAAIEQAGIQIPQQFLPLLTASPASLIEGALDYVHDQYGDAAHYLTGKGLASADIDALRSRFISSAAHAYGHDDGFDGAHSQEGL
jgi:protein-tyrosine phosphatase